MRKHLVLARSTVVALAAALFSGLSLADYFLPVSATVRSDLAFRTFAMDQENEFQAASQLVTVYIKAWGLAEAKIVANEYLYVIYHDGKIGKFKIVSLRDTIKVSFESLVPAAPANVQKLSDLDIPLTVEFVRFDYAQSANTALFVQEKIFKPSITVIQYSSFAYFIDFNWGGGCAPIRGGGCENPILLRSHD